MADRRQRVGVVFGGRSVEHGISVLTASQAMAAMDQDRYTVIPIYFSVDGEAFVLSAPPDISKFPGLPLDPTEFERFVRREHKRAILVAGSKGSLLRVRGFLGQWRPMDLDVVMPLIHGSHGEDGTLQGLLELADVPYVGPNVLAAAAGMDKITAKAICKAYGIQVADDLWFTRREWACEKNRILDDVDRDLGYPVFVKPASLGSSIAVTRAANASDLEMAADVALCYDRRCLIERSVEDSLEINCAVVGGPGVSVRASVCERPLRDDELLSYEEKYLSGDKGGGLESARREIPASLPEDVTAAIRQLAVKAFRAVGCDGVARVDFLVQPDGWSIYLNEVNTIPGSLAFYLWEATGVTFGVLIDQLILSARNRQDEKVRTIYSLQEVPKLG